MSDLLLGHRTGGGSSKTDISTATVTLQTQSFTYDGTIKTRNVSSVVLNGQTLTAGTDYVVIGNKAVNAGTYRLLVAGTGNYDGFVSADWSINRAQGSISVSPSSLTIYGATGSTDTATLTIVGDGNITISSDASSVATATRNGNTVTVTNVGDGSATITITLAAGTNYTSGSTTISVSVSTVSATLADNTPAQIQSVAQSGIAASVWSVGARTAEISIGAVGNMSATSACAFIIGFNHNSSVEGTGIHFQFGKTTSGTDIAFVDSGCNDRKSSGTWFNMNNISSNSGGWSGSRMHTTVCPAFKAALPSAWQSAIKGCKKWTDNTGGGSNTASNVTETTDDIFLLAEKEVFGSISRANSSEGNKQEQYAYYANGNSKIKYKHNATTMAYHWWLRSAYASSSYYFVHVGANGADSYNYTDYSYGFAPGFMVG